MADTNSFKQLEEENEAKFETHKLVVKKNVEGRKDFWSFLGDIIDLYIPRIFSTLFGSNNTKTKK